MAKSKVQMQKGYSLFEFFQRRCLRSSKRKGAVHLAFSARYRLSECANKTFYQLKSLPRVLQGNHRGYPLSLTGNTIFANTKLPLTKWFLAMHLLS